MPDFIGRVSAATEPPRIVGMFSDFEVDAAGLPVGAIVRVRADSLDVLALPGSAQATVFEILERHGLDPDPSPESLAEVAALLDAPGFDDDVTDRTGLPFVTIDNEDSRDLDQALFIERAEAGYRVWYALADASYYVRPGSELHRRALERGTTYYLPSLAAPMLPRALSEGIVSLNPEVDRRALVFISTIAVDGTCTGTEIERARIRSRAKLSYTGVQQMFDQMDAPATDPTPHNRLHVQGFTESLLLLREVGELRANLARERDVIEYDRRSPKVMIRPQDSTEFTLVPRERNDVERWNEQISLLCNIEGARLLQEYGHLSDDLQAVFRVHLPPLGERLAALHESLEELADAHGLPDVWRWSGPRRQSLADYVDGLPREAQTARIRQAIDRFVRYSNRASEFCPEAGPHHALGVDAYARFSSPMREIVGVFTHKELLEAMGMAPARAVEDDETLRSRVISSANAAKARQKRLDKEVQLEVITRLLRSELGTPHDERRWRVGTVVGVNRGRAYVCMDEFAIDLKVYPADFIRSFGSTPDFSDAWIDVGNERIRIGDAVRLRVVGWDAGRQRYGFDIALF